MAEVNDFIPTRVIVLSELSARDKEKYYSILVSQDSKFHYDRKGRIISNVRLLSTKSRRVINESKVDHVSKDIGFSERLLRLDDLPENGIKVIIKGIESFDYSPYKSFVGMSSEPGEIVKPKKHVLTWVMRLVEDFYDSRFTFEKQHVQKDPTLSSSSSLESFPIFVMKQLCTLVGLKPIVDQFAWDLLWNAHQYRRDYLDIEIFMRFLQEIYDNDDLLFFLYARSVISKQLRIQYKRRWVSSEGLGKGPKAQWMSFKEVCLISRTIFGASDDNRQVLSEFMALVMRNIVGKKTDTGDSRRIDVIQFLHLAVVTYHQMQADGALHGRNGGTKDYIKQSYNTTNSSNNIDMEYDSEMNPFVSKTSSTGLPINPNPAPLTSVTARLDAPPARKQALPVFKTKGAGGIPSGGSGTANSSNSNINTMNSMTSQDMNDTTNQLSLNQLSELNNIDGLDDLDEFLRKEEITAQLDMNGADGSNGDNGSGGNDLVQVDLVQAVLDAERERKNAPKQPKPLSDYFSADNVGGDEDIGVDVVGNGDDGGGVDSDDEYNSNIAAQVTTSSTSFQPFQSVNDDENNNNDDNYQYNQDYVDAEPEMSSYDVDGNEVGTIDGVSASGSGTSGVETLGDEAWVVAATICNVPVEMADDFEECYMDRAQEVLAALLEDLHDLNEEQQTTMVDVMFDQVCTKMNSDFKNFDPPTNIEDFDEILQNLITTDDFMSGVAGARDEALQGLQ